MNTMCVKASLPITKILETLNAGSFHPLLHGDKNLAKISHENK